MSVNRPQSSSSCFADDEPPSEFAIKHVVKCLLKQHHQYTEEELCEYLPSNFPEIPKPYRSTLVIATSAAAKYVSSVALVADTFRHSPNLSKSKLAKGAKDSLVIWNFVLQQNSSSVRDSDIPSLTQLTNRDVTVVTGASSHSTVHSGPSIAISTQFPGATSSRVGGGDDNIISDPSHSMTQAESSIAQSALEVQQKDDSVSNRVDPSLFESNLGSHSSRCRTGSEVQSRLGVGHSVPSRTRAVRDGRVAVPGTVRMRRRIPTPFQSKV